jgi:hypothetical protein
MHPQKHFNPERGSSGAQSTPERAPRSQEAIAEGSRTIAEHAPRALGSAQRGFTNKLRQIVIDDLSLRGETMPPNAQVLFAKAFRTNPNIPAEAKTLNRTREETVIAVRNSIARGAISARDVSPTDAIAPISIDGNNIPYTELLARVQETLAVSVQGKKILKVLEESGMSRVEAGKAVGELAAAIARAESIERFVGSDVLGVRSSTEKLREKNPPRQQPTAPPRHLTTLDQALQSTGAKIAKIPERTQTSDEARKKAYEVLGEMAKQSGLEIPVRVGGKIRPVSFIISPRHERDEEDKPVEGGAEWFEIKRALHVIEPKGDQTEKRYEPTNLIKEGVPNGLVVRTPDDIPDALMDGLREWGFDDNKETAFLWILAGGKEGAKKWRERMNIGEQAQPESEPAK